MGLLDNQCISTIPVGRAFTFWTYLPGGSSFTTSTTITSTPLTAQAMAVNGYKFAAVSNPTSSSTHVSSRTTLVSTSSSSSTAAPHGSGLISVAKAGISVAIAFALVVICGLVAALAIYIRRNKRAAQLASNGSGGKLMEQDAVQVQPMVPPSRREEYRYELGPSNDEVVHEMAVTPSSQRESINNKK